MNGSSLRSRIQDERANDPRFRRGYQLCSELAIALIVIRLLSPAMGWFTSHIVPDFMADVIFPLLMGVCIFFSSRDGQRRFSGWLCILIGAAVRLAAFNLPELARVTDSDEMYIGRLGEEKRAIFCVIPDNDTSLNFLVSMLYTQAFQELYYIADQKYGGPLPVHVQCIQDEWANTPQPDNYLQILRTARSRNIGCSVVVQGLSAIKAMYKESWEEVVGNCDSFLFLGGNDQESLSYISKMTGKATIDTITRGETKGRGGSSSRNFQNTGRELVTPEELRMVDRDALLLIRGECPVLDRKYDLNRHPNIRYTEMGGAPPYKVPEDYCVLSAGIPAEDVQEEWKKGTPLAPELLSAFEVLHSKEELEEKKIERKKEQA